MLPEHRHTARCQVQRRVAVQVARLAAASSWVPAVEHLLSHAPITAEDCDLWLQLLPLIQTLLSTHAVQPPSLQLLALLLHQAATPVLGSRQAAQATLSLPLALTSHTDAAALFSGAQQQLQDVQLAQVELDAWLACHCVFSCCSCVMPRFDACMIAFQRRHNYGWYTLWQSLTLHVCIEKAFLRQGVELKFI